MNVRTLRAALFRAAKRRHRKSVQTSPGGNGEQTGDTPSPPSGRDATPIHISGGATGVLLLHGFNGVPGELRSLAAALASRGCTVEGPLLAGHGGSAETLAAATWGDWVASADEAYQGLRERCSTVIVAGFSTGGAIALHLAAQGRALDGVVTMATPAYISSPFVHLLPVARYVVPYVSPLRGVDLSNPAVIERMRTYIPALDVDPNDPAQHAELRRSIRISVKAVHELTRLLRVVRSELGRVTVPVLLIQARDDEVVPRPSMAILLRGVGSRDKDFVYLQQGGHMLPVGPAHEIVAEHVTAFVNRIAGVAQAAAGSS